MTDKLEQLCLAARRGELTVADEQELEQLLRAEPEERLWHEAGLRFDAEDAAGNDGAAIERLRQRLAARAPAAPPRRRGPTVALLAAAALLLASAAAAFIAVQRYRARESTVLPPAPAPVQSLPPPTPRAESLEAPAPVLPETPKPPSAPSSGTTPSATELLSAAGQARRQGQTARALGLLQTLRSRYPGSAEARASDITLGMLRLQSGAPAQALAEFERYLQRSPGGDRTADALWGKAQALSALGRGAEARTTLESLLGRYPSSPYTSAARAKLRSSPH